MEHRRTPRAWRVVSAVSLFVGLLAPMALSTPASAELTGQVFTQIVAGSTNTCALSTQSVLYCWGSNHYGQLLNGTTLPRLTPTPLNLKPWLGSNRIASFATGNGTTCALDVTSVAICWGYGGQGQLGNGLYSNAKNPVHVAFPGHSGSFVELAGTGSNSFCALTSTSQIWCWGGNSYGQLGNDTTLNSATPVLVSQSGVLQDKVITQISGSDQTFCAVSQGGFAFCWGFGEQGALGNGSTSNSKVPVQVTESTDLNGHALVQIAPATDHTCALDNQHNVYCWGSNRYGTDGLGLPNGTTHSTSMRKVPYRVTALNNLGVVSVSSSATNSCAVTGAGKAYCWGGDPFGDGTVSGIATLPQLIGGAVADNKIIASSSGYFTTCLLDNTGATYCAGTNTNGTVGNGTTDVTSSPVQVSQPPTSVPVSTVPSAPIGVAVLPGNGTLTVTWSPPTHNGNAPITSYIVRSDPAGAICTTAGLVCVLHNLAVNVPYVVSVTARNAVGLGTPANSIVVFALNPTKLTIHVTTRIVSPSVGFLVVAAGMKKGTKVTFTLTNVAPTSCVMSSLRQCFVALKEPRTGVYRVVAKAGGLTTTDFFYVPLIQVPAKIIHGHTATIRLASCPAQAAVVIKLSDKRVYRPTSSAQGTVTVLIPMPNKGNVGVLTSVAGVSLVPDHTIAVL